MDDDCPPTPVQLLPERNSKSAKESVSHPESDSRRSPIPDTSPEGRCPICLGKLHNMAFTDICLHQFCFQCLVQWTKVKPECPLCKQPIKSILHSIKSNLDFERYNIESSEPAYVVSEILQSYDFDLVPVDSRVRYRSTMTREYFRELGSLSGARTSYRMPNFIPTPTFHIQPSSSFSPASERRSARGGSDFRRRIYEEDLWVRDLSDITGRYRENTPQFYRENPAQIHRIIPWLSREINSLMDDNESYTAYILDRVLSFLPQYSIRSLEFRSVVEPYFGPRTDHFIHEFFTFTRSVYDVTGFDLHASYVPNPNYATEVQEVVSSNEDSDIEIMCTLPNRGSTSTSTSTSTTSASTTSTSTTSTFTIPTSTTSNSTTSSQLRRSHFQRSTRTATTISNEPVAGPSGINNPTRSNAIEVVEVDNDDVRIINCIRSEPEVVILSSGDDGPLNSGNQRSRLMKRNGITHDSLSEATDSSSKRFKPDVENRKNKSNYTPEKPNTQPKAKNFHQYKKRSSSASSSSGSASSSSGSANSVNGGSIGIKRGESSSNGFSTESIRGRSGLSSPNGGSTSDSDFESDSKSTMTLSKGNIRKLKGICSRRSQRKGCKNEGANNKVGSGGGAPKFENNGGTSHTSCKNGETSSQNPGNSRTEGEASSSSSNWPLINNNSENPSEMTNNET